MTAVSGSFTTTGSSSEFGANGSFLLSLAFGAGTVNLQRKLDGTNWRTIQAFTASAETVVDIDNHGGTVPHRLNCSAHSSDIAYWMGHSTDI